MTTASPRFAAFGSEGEAIRSEGGRASVTDQIGRAAKVQWRHIDFVAVEPLAPAPTKEVDEEPAPTHTPPPELCFDEFELARLCAAAKLEGRLQALEEISVAQQSREEILSQAVLDALGRMERELCSERERASEIAAKATEALLQKLFSDHRDQLLEEKVSELTEHYLARLAQDVNVSVACHADDLETVQNLFARAQSGLDGSFHFTVATDMDLAAGQVVCHADRTTLSIDLSEEPPDHGSRNTFLEDQARDMASGPPDEHQNSKSDRGTLDEPRSLHKDGSFSETTRPER